MGDSAKLMVDFLFCNKCRNETEHICQSEHHRDYPDYIERNMIGIVERIGYRFWVCSGCKTGTLEEYYVFDITAKEYKEDESLWTKKYYPTRNQYEITLKDFKQLTKKLTTIYRETLSAYNNNLAILCAFGIRALLEGICADKKISGRNLQEKINNMVSILPKNIVLNLHSIGFIGNEAAHELSAPSNSDLKLAIELCEDLLNFIYELNYKAKSLNDSRKKEKEKIVKTKVAKTSQ